LIYRDMEKKKSIMPHSSCGSEASLKPEETHGVSVDKCNVAERARVLPPSTLPSCSLQHRSPSTSELLTQVLTRLHDRR
jgi:hypothetical protein